MNINSWTIIQETILRYGPPRRTNVFSSGLHFVVPKNNGFPMKEVVLLFHENGNPRSVHYYENGDLHRDPADGPARIRFDENGEETSRCYFHNGADC